MTGEGFGSAEAKAGGLGNTLTKFAAFGGAALALVGVESVRMASKFDASMEMLVTQAGVSQSKLAGLKSGVLSLAGQVGFNPDSLAESLYHVASNMASLGATAPQMLNIVKIAAEGARVGGADLVDVTNALTAAVASGIPGVQNYSQAMGMLNATVGAGDMKMQDLAEAFGTGMVAVVKGYGLSLKDVGAALAVFGDNNIRGAHAGTQLRMAVQALAVPAAAGKKQLTDLGMSTTQMARDMQSGGLLKALTDLQSHMTKAGITAKEQGQVITTIFGKKAGTGVAILLEQMDRLKSKYPAITKGANGFGDAWAQTQKQAATTFAQLTATVQALMIQLGNRLLPAVQAVAAWMLRNKSAVEAAVVVFGGLVVVLGVYVGVVKVVLTSMKLWKDATTAVTAAAKGLRAGVQVMLDFTSGFRNADAAASAFSGTAGTMGGNVRSVFSSIASASKSAWSSIASGVQVAAQTAAGWVTAGAKAAWAGAQFLAVKTAQLAVAAATRIWAAAQAVFNAIMDANPIMLIVLGIAALIIVLIEAYKHSKLFRDIVHEAGVVAKAAFGLILRAAEETFDWIKGHWRLLLMILLGPVGLAIVGIIRYWHVIMAGIDQLVGFIRSAWGAVYGILVGPFEAAWRDIQPIISAVSGFLSTIGSVGGGVLSKVGSFFGFGTGGIVGAATGGVHGGLRLVGEYGPELVRLPSGSSVYSNADSVSGTGGGGGAQHIIIELQASDSKILSGLQAVVRSNGGDPQMFIRKVAFR